MNRKEFLQQAGRIAFGTGAGLVALERSGGSARAQSSQADGRQKVVQDWIVSLMKNMDATLPEGERIRVMEQCGRDCARRGPVSLARQHQGDLDGLLSKLAGHLGPDNARRDGNKVFITYNKCFCPLVSAGPERLSETYCHCSRGWLKEMLETVSGKSVEVVLKESIKRGASSCRFEAAV